MCQNIKHTKQVAKLIEDSNSFEIDKPLVSIIIPAYQAELYIERCVRSLMEQTYRNLEIIVVDDCSTDTTGTIVEGLALEDSRISVFHHKNNQGYSGARNTGLNHANGEYFTFVDSDDWVEPDYIAYLMNIIDTTHADIALSRNFYTSRYRKQIDHDSISITSPEEFLLEIFYNRIHVGIWNRMYKRSVIGNTYFDLEAIAGEDMLFNVQVVPNAHAIGVGLRRIYTYNVDNNMSATKKPDVKKQAYGAVHTMDIIKRVLVPRNKRLDNALEYQYFTTVLYGLTHLVRANAVSNNIAYYNDLVRYLRQTAPKTFQMEINYKQKIKSLAVWISPYITVKLAIFWRYGLNVKKRNA